MFVVQSTKRGSAKNCDALVIPVAVFVGYCWSSLAQHSVTTNAVQKGRTLGCISSKHKGGWVGKAETQSFRYFESMESNHFQQSPQKCCPISEIDSVEYLTTRKLF